MKTGKTVVIVKKRDKIILHALIISFFLFYTCYFFCSALPVIRDKISDKITQKNIDSLYLGMNDEDVLNILGKPFNTFSSKEKYILSYAKKGVVFYTEVYMYIKNNKLDGIHMEFDDVGFYTCTYDYCPKVIDRYTYDITIPVN